MANPSIDPLSSDVALHSPWMRRLARSLVQDPSVAEDVVQDAWARIGGRGARAGYLAAAVRSLAHRYHRGARRRRDREHGAARSEALPSAAEVAERIETVQRVARALDELDEPYRTTLVLRYFDDLSAAEIARRAGVPSSTVRARLRRGLEKMRARLDERHGSRASWVSALLPLSHRSAGISPALVATLSTVVAMKFVLGSLLGLCAVALLWTYVSGDGRGEDPPPLVTDTGAVSGAALVGARKQDASGDADPGARLSLDEASSTAALAPKPEGAPGSGRVSARAVDAEQDPIRGAWLRLRQAPGTAAQSGSDGRLELSVAPEELERLAQLNSSRSIGIQIGGPGFRTHQVRAFLAEGRTILELGEVSLRPGSILNGRVVDASGLGVEGARVTFGAPIEAEPGESRQARRGPRDLEARSWGGTAPALVTTSGPGGAFRLQGIAAGYGTVWARGPVSLWAFSQPIGVRKGEEVSGIELVLHDAPDEIITGTVLDPDGRPVPGLELTFMTRGSGGGNTGHTDDRGRFYFAPLDGAAQDIGAISPDWEWEHQQLLGVPVGTLELVIAFERSEWLEISVRDPDGAAVGNGRVTGLPGDGPTDRAIPRSDSPLDERGHARLRRPAGRLRVRVEAPGYRYALLGPFDPALFADPLVVTLEKLPALVGQVLLADGRPAAGARVGLHRGVGARSGNTAPGQGPSGGRSYLTHQGWAGDGEAFVYGLHTEPDAQVTADEQGHFRLPLPGVDPQAAGEVERVQQGFGGMGYAGRSGTHRVSGGSEDQPWFVHAVTDASASITSGPHHFEATRDAQLELQLPPGGSIAGRLVLRDGSSTAGWTARASDGLARIAEAWVAEDGSFHFEHLHPGGWQVSVFSPGQRFSGRGGRLRTERVPEPVVEVVSGATVEYEHQSGRRKGALLRGRLWLDGRPPGPWQVLLHTATKQAAISRYEVSIDPDGNFELALEPGLRTTLWITRPGQGGRFHLSADLEIVPGQNDWSFDLETARIEGQVGASLAVKSRYGGPFYLVQEGGTSIRVSLLVDEQGHFGPTIVPAGRGTLHGTRTSPRDEAPTWAELDLDAGEVRTLDLR